MGAGGIGWVGLVGTVEALVIIGIGWIGLVGRVEDRPVGSWTTKDRGDFGAAGISRVVLVFDRTIEDCVIGLVVVVEGFVTVGFG